MYNKTKLFIMYSYTKTRVWQVTPIWTIFCIKMIYIALGHKKCLDSKELYMVSHNN